MNAPESTTLEPTCVPVIVDREPRHLGGLIGYFEGEPRALPLCSVKVRAHIAGDCCQTVVEQQFRNDYDVPLEATHIFPLPADGAVTEMVLVAGERRIRAECRERDDAQDKFDEARKSGHRAALLTEELADVHTMNVTNLPAGSDVSVRIVVHERLEHADGRHLWRFPTVIAPRYLPGRPIGHTGKGVLPDTIAAPDASRLQPPLRLDGGTILDLEVAIDGSLTALETSMHAVRMDLGEGGGFRVAPSGQATLDRDFVLSFTTAEAGKAAARSWTDGAHTLVVLEPPTGDAAPAMPRDATFIVDTSGSMHGTKMTAARRALSTALHGLVAGDRFNIVAFSQSYELFSRRLVEYSDDTVSLADDWIGRLDAGGGTKMLPAVQAALEGEVPEGRLRTVLLITDGQVWNEDELVSAVAGETRSTRFFTMGIDTAVNDHVLKRLARTGGGTCDLLTPRDDIEGAVARLEARFGSPVVDNVRVVGATPADSRSRTLFAGRPVSMILEGAHKSVVVSGDGPEGEWSQMVDSEPTSTTLAALWARERVSALEDKLLMDRSNAGELEREITEVALSGGILSRFTAFVVVDTKVTETGERVEVVQPVELPHEWDERFLSGPDSSATMHADSAHVHSLAHELRSPALEEDRNLLLCSADTMASMPIAAGRLRSGTRRSISASDEGGRGDEQSVLASDIARRQRVDGSIDGDVDQTVACLVALVFLGNTSKRGNRQRTVAKAATYLRQTDDGDRVRPVLELLACAEAGDPIDKLRAEFWSRLVNEPLLEPLLEPMVDVVWPDHP